MQNAWYAGFEAGSGSARMDGGGAWRGLRIPQQLMDAMTEEQRIEDMHRGIEREYIIDAQPVDDGATLPVASGAAGETVVPNQIMTNDPVSMPLTPAANTPVTLPKSSPLLPARPSAYGSGAPLPTQIVPADIPIIQGRNPR